MFRKTPKNSHDYPKYTFTNDEKTRIYREDELENEKLIGNHKPEDIQDIPIIKHNRNKDVMTGNIDMTDPKNPDERNKDIATYEVRVYFLTNREHRFPARNLDNARDIAARCVNQHVWIIDDDGDEEFFPPSQIHKVKIVKK